MYYSNPQVNYMVTVFIRLVIAVVYTLPLLSCSKRFVCLCLFQYRHCFLVGWCTNKSYVIATSDLWLFTHASNLLPSTPHPHSPTKAGAASRIQSFARCLQPRQPSPPTWRNAPCRRWCSSTLDGSWRMGSSVVGRLTNVALPVNSWFGPAHFGLMSQERSGTTSARGALWCHALGKRKRTGKKRL